MERSSRKPKRGDRFEVQIERLAVGGRGVARVESLGGLVLFVADAAPGDQCEVEITLAKKNFAQAEIIRLITPSPLRIKPPCPVAGVCGGCNWQHLSYQSQLGAKKQLVIESLDKFSGYATRIVGQDIVSDVEPSPKEFRYRNRIQLHHAQGLIGFYARGSHRIVPIDDCPITDERLTQLFPALKAEFAAQLPGRFEIYLTQQGETARRSNSRDEDEPSEAAQASGPAFSQVNTEQNAKLVENVVETVGSLLNEFNLSRDLFDFYAGSGNFTFPLAHAYPQLRLTGVELNSESVTLANDHAARYFAPSRLSFVQQSVDDYVRSAQISGDSLVLLDPPRAGCGPEVISQLVRFGPRAILYVSCHPVTLARDLKPLAEAGYQLRSVRPFDMFPQTDHIETFAVVVRASARAES